MSVTPLPARRPGLDNVRLREWRHATNARIEVICARAEISVDYLRELEQGRKQPTLDVVIRIGAAYGRDPRELIIPMTAEDAAEVHAAVLL